MKGPKEIWMALHDEAELGRLRSLLDERERVLRGEVDALRAEQADVQDRAPDGNVADAGERGEARTREAVRHVEQRRDTQELQEIAAARARMDEGRYGECVDCGCDIPLARLQVQPAAARCIPCQERFEQGASAVPHAPLPGAARDGPPSR